MHLSVFISEYIYFGVIIQSSIYFLINLREKIEFNEIREGQLGKWFFIKDLNTISLAPDIKAIKFKLWTKFNCKNVLLEKSYSNKMTIRSKG